MKQRLSQAGVSSVVLLATSLAFASTADPPNDEVARSESKPVAVNDAEFVVLTEAKWRIPKPGSGDTSIDTEMRIRNLTKAEQLFHTMDAYKPSIQTADGKHLPRKNGWRRITCYTEPERAAPGKACSIRPWFSLQWDAKAKAGTLVYEDGTGWTEVWSPMRPGRYTLGFLYTTEFRKKAAIYELMDKGAGIDTSGAWAGRVLTGEAPFEVIGP